MTIDVNALMKKARHASQYAYCPYSGVQVGAAVLTKDEDVFTGCNVENASYGLTNCAERTAIFNAVSAGKTIGDFSAVAVAGRPLGKEWQFCSPCGACRQVIYQVSQKGEPITVVYLDKTKTVKSVSIDELLPDGFRL
jgi:cytidine deaminase